MLQLRGRQRFRKLDRALRADEMTRDAVRGRCGDLLQCPFTDSRITLVAIIVSLRWTATTASQSQGPENNSKREVRTSEAGNRRQECGRAFGKQGLCGEEIWMCTRLRLVFREDDEVGMRTPTSTGHVNANEHSTNAAPNHYSGR